MTYGFVSPRDLRALGAPESPVELQEPAHRRAQCDADLAAPRACSRPSEGARHGEGDARLFTVGVTFRREDDDAARPSSRAAGRSAFAAGSRRAYLGQARALRRVRRQRGGAEIWSMRTTGRTPSVVLQGRRRTGPLISTRAARRTLLVDTVRVGQFGPLHPDVIAAWDLGASGGSWSSSSILRRSPRSVAANPRSRRFPAPCDHARHRAGGARRCLAGSVEN